jgi:tetratricopeptide (TPR) repeat protein
MTSRSDSCLDKSFGVGSGFFPSRHWLAWVVLVVCSGLLGCATGPSPDDMLKSQKEYELAVGLWQEQNTPGTFQHLFIAIGLDNDNAPAHQMLGNLYLFRGEWSKAEKHLREVIRIQKRSPDARNSLGVLYIHQGHYDKAIAELKIATEDLLNREPHLAWGNLGWAYYEKKMYADSEMALRQSVRAEPRFCVGYFRLGQTLSAMKNYEEAEKALTAGLEVNDKSCQGLQEAWQLRGQTRAHLGRREDAVADFERCIELKPETEVGKSCNRQLQAGH